MWRNGNFRHDNQSTSSFHHSLERTIIAADPKMVLKPSLRPQKMGKMPQTICTTSVKSSTVRASVQILQSQTCMRRVNHLHELLCTLSPTVSLISGAAVSTAPSAGHSAPASGSRASNVAHSSAALTLTFLSCPLIRDSPRSVLG